MRGVLPKRLTRFTYTSCGFLFIHRPGFPELRKEWEKELEDDSTDSSKAPPALDPEGGSDWFEDYY